MDPTILQSEAEFADSEYAPSRHDLALNERMFRKYSQPRNWWDWRQFAAHLLGDIAGKTLLDYGCGKGEEATYFAKLGANVTAIDASSVGVEITRDRAAFNGVADRVHAEVMDATATTFPDNSFEIVHGLGILHHVGLQTGLQEVKRLLVPGGSAVFLEPMGNISLIEKSKAWLHRRLVRKLHLIKVTDDEENLKLEEILRCVPEFSSFQAYPYRLSYRVRRLFCPRALHPLLERLDYCFLKVFPGLKALAGAVVIHLRK
jgi:2-polyprenyl-3-methyl-5-hydroxy-6-metoxy-1,4-benzoquinol methylase